VSEIPNSNPTVKRLLMSPKGEWIMSFLDLVKAVKAIVPDAVFFEDGEGQLHIATGFAQNGHEDEPLDCVKVNKEMYPFERDTSDM